MNGIKLSPLFVNAICAMTGLLPGNCLHALKPANLKLLFSVERDELIQMAKDKGLNIYGNAVVGGTAVIIAGNVDFKKIGLRTDLPNQPLPNLTWNIISQVPNFMLVFGALLSGIWWITERRKDVEEFEKKTK